MMFGDIAKKAIASIATKLKANIEETKIPAEYMEQELKNLSARVAKNGLELRRVQDGANGFLGYYVAKAGAPMLKDFDFS